MLTKACLTSVGTNEPTKDVAIRFPSTSFRSWSVCKADGPASDATFYIRQLRDGKISAVIEDWDTRLLRAYGRMCAHALARAHARSSDAAIIAGYVGSARVMDDAVTEFAVDYADQNQRDYRLFVRAHRQGRLKATIEE